MIKIIQPGQIGQTKYMIDMHRTRAKIFKERMHWDVEVDHMAIESDEYDLPETIYVLSLDDHENVVGTWRFLTTSQPSMIRSIWPQYLASLPIPQSDNMIETSRFGVHLDHESYRDRFGFEDNADTQKHIKRATSFATAEMLVSLIDACIMCGIADMYTLYSVKVKRLLERIGFKPYAVSEILELEGEKTVTAHFKMNDELLQAVQDGSGVLSEVTPNILPPALVERYVKHQATLQEREVQYA